MHILLTCRCVLSVLLRCCTWCSWLSPCLRSCPCSTALTSLISCLVIVCSLHLIPFSIPVSLLVKKFVFPSFALQGKNSKGSVHHLHSVSSWEKKWLIWVGNDLNRFLGYFRWLVKKKKLPAWKGKQIFLRLSQGWNGERFYFLHWKC